MSSTFRIVHAKGPGSPKPLPEQLMTRIVLVEDQVVIRQLCAQSIRRLAGFQVVGEASNLKTAAELCRTTQPHVVILDLNLEGGSGLELLRTLRREKSNAHCLIFSGITNPAVLQTALLLGARGVVEKTGTLEQFTKALRAVVGGGTYLSPLIAAAMRKFLSGSDVSAKGDLLTNREEEVLTHIAQGLSNKEVAAQLGVSVHTAENHRANLIRKTGLQSQAKLTMLALQLGLIQSS